MTHDFSLHLQRFSSLDKVIEPFCDPLFLSLPLHEKQERVNAALYTLVMQAEVPCFLLGAVLEYIHKIESLGILDSYTLSHFELWLNQFSGVSQEENAEVRARIVGKRVPRSAYQSLFPIGMGKIYPGSHFVTAHGSPDLDTTVASFWGWVDAFGARVSEGLHLWNVPGGAPESLAEIDLLFHTVLGPNVFNALAKTRVALSLSAMDLMTQKGFVKEKGDRSILTLDHEGNKKAIVLVGESGEYVGDWKGIDVEAIRQVISSLNHCLRWFAHYVEMQLLALFADPASHKKAVDVCVEELLGFALEKAPPVQELTEKQKWLLHAYLVKVLKVELGLKVPFGKISHFMPVVQLLENRKELFDKVGALVEDRRVLFGFLKKVSAALDEAFEKVRLFVERLDVAIDMKAELFGLKPEAIGYRADVDEIRSKMTDQSYLSVVSADVPLGVIHWEDISKPVLGTVTLRDFCNTEETKIPSYLEVISVIDHHKSRLQTTTAPVTLIADAQSSNVLCAEMAFQMNDRFGTRGMSAKEIQSQVNSNKNKRILAQLLQRQANLEEQKGHFIDPLRETLEYLQFFYGILDDTDLLTKVSHRDLECVAHLINRLKSLFTKKEVEVISLNDLPYDEQFTKKARERILQHPDVYSLYSKVYAAKEKLVESSILEEAKGERSTFFADTKEQNGCARVGQAKLFPSNYKTFQTHRDAIEKRWLEKASDIFSHHAQIDLHMQMISTIAGAEEVYSGSQNHYTHEDELWIWIPFSDASIEHLKEFLSAFGRHLKGNAFTAEFFGAQGKLYEEVFRESFPLLSKGSLHPKHPFSCAILRYKAGLLNSRKAMISPHLPRLVR
ncbi:MAG: hypothetical protein RLZZ453_713 [Chlamydiota bacterium]|jgi:hypothetical protein